jgi:hypothetical protein
VRYPPRCRTRPAHTGELLSRPGGYQRMLGMKKLIIADF